MASVSATSQIGQIKSVLRQASAATGTDFDYLLRTAQRESSLRPHIKAETSSATGLFQFIDQTWLATLKSAGQQYGYGKFADAIERMPDGRHKVTDPALRREILALRKDPLAASLMAGAYTRDAAERLTSALGRAPSKGELYVAHFLGPGGAIRLIKSAEATPDRAAAELFPSAARANRWVFYDKNGDARTAKDLYTKMVSAYGPGKAEFAPVRAAATEQAPTAPTLAVPPAAAAQPPAGTPVEPVAAHFRLASHFQNVQPDAPAATAGRPFQSLFITPAGAPLAEPAATPSAGPMMLIPQSVRADTPAAAVPAQGAVRKDGAIEARADGGPMNIIPRAPIGLLQKHAPLYALFRTAAADE
jgi:hypothetical protein